MIRLFSLCYFCSSHGETKRKRPRGMSSLNTWKENSWEIGERGACDAPSMDYLLLKDSLFWEGGRGACYVAFSQPEYNYASAGWPTLNTLCPNRWEKVLSPVRNGTVKTFALGSSVCILWRSLCRIWLKSNYTAGWSTSTKSYRLLYGVISADQWETDQQSKHQLNIFYD
jgi:hypothetical protein